MVTSSSIRAVDEAVPITEVRVGRSDDIEMRQRRYILTMTIRTTCFGLMFFVPGLWKFVAIAGAAVLPAIAVVLANNRDNRSQPVVRAQEPAPTLAISPGQVIKGEVDETDR
ncbi:hypothetical protein GCM10027030_13850 [Luteococcus sediminum]